jgi:radical SAM superfamily enzyme YgiQ (UPF0313 family)
MDAGDGMKTILVAIDAKYIHQNLAVRSLMANTTFLVELKEFTIKDDPKRIAAALMEEQPDVLGFSVYLWNVRLVESILSLIRPNMHAKIVLGGPEVTYDDARWIETNLADYVVLGEGELAFDGLLRCIEMGKEPSDIPNIAFHRRVDAPRLEPIRDLTRLKSPYPTMMSDNDIQTRIQYVEASRGCPYRCSYCLASLEKPLRFFPIERVKTDLSMLIDHGAKTIKFLDRTFNANKRLIELIEFLIDRARDDLSIQFEITGDLFSEDIVDYVNARAPKGLFRFEIGVQSTSDETNRLVDRRQDTPRLFSVVRKLQNAGVVDLHLDLIAGLPGETLHRFRQTFDETYALGAKELQLGILKLLKGTKLRAQARRFGYVYDDESPYVMKSSDCLSAAELEVILAVEVMLDRLHNKGFFRRTLEKARLSKTSMFDWFYELHHVFVSQALDPSRVDLLTLFSTTDRWLESQGETALRETLKWDYLERFPRKPKCWWADSFFEDREFWIAKACARHPEWKREVFLRQSVLIPMEGRTLLVWYANEKVSSLLL